MVVGAHPQPQPQQQQQQQLQQKPPQQPETSAEEEALKRNTDCVYFLASPLTCKKGSECEYRHSEYARVNPRDCWYWLNGSCLNLKCAFRHPPLDGLLGSPAANSAGPSLPLSHPVITPTTPATHAAYNPSKQAVPCIFFQKGQCLKGEKCAFSHGPNPMASSKVMQTPAAPHGTEPSGLKKAFGGLQKCTQELKVPNASVAKSVGVPPEAKPAPKIPTAPIRNGVSIERNVLSTKALDDEALRYKATSVPPVINGGSTSQANHLAQVHVSDYHGFQNVKDVDEHLRESSPGFDVLVDDELGDSDYYHGEDRFGRTRGHEGRNLNSVNEYDLDRPVDYTSMADVDGERFCDPRGYDPYDRMQGQYAWDQYRASSERQLMGPAFLERRGYRKSESPENIDELDLRHRLSKHRRVNGLRSIVSHDYAVDGHVEEQNNRPLRDSQQLPPHEGSRSSRLHGRIKLPGGSSPVNGSDLHQEREVDRARSQGRLSPRRPQISSHQGRLRDRIKGRVEEDYDNDRRNFGAPRVRREIMDDRGDDFSRPKRLSDLKVVKDAENKEQSYLGTQTPMLSLCTFVFLATFSLFLFSFSVFKNLQKTEHKQQTYDDLFELKRSLSQTLGKTHPARENNPTHLDIPPHKLLVEILPSDSSKWASLFVNSEGGGPDKAGSGLDGEKVGSEGHKGAKKKKKRRAKKKKSSHLEEEEEDGSEDLCGQGNSGPGLGSRVKEELVCFYPFTSSSSATQRKIKQQYDELMKCHESEKLTLAQVGQFANCLVDARNELHHKADVIQRKFTITKALLFKADRSSFDRLHQQMCKLELEQKRLEEDASVYNWLQQQLKLSPAYKKIFEISTHIDLKAKSREQTESTDVEFTEISFEELLAQEKKDSFWQKNRKSRSCSS